MADNADHVGPRSAHVAFNVVHGLMDGRDRLFGRDAAMINNDEPFGRLAHPHIVNCVEAGQRARRFREFG